MVDSNIFYFHPYLGKIPILTNIFQRGWFNHQLGITLDLKYRTSSISDEFTNRSKNSLQHGVRGCSIRILILGGTLTRVSLAFMAWDKLTRSGGGGFSRRCGNESGSYMCDWVNQLPLFQYNRGWSSTQ